jgi:hypothetical protein
MRDPISTLVGQLAGFGFLFMMLVAFTLGVMWPLMALSVVRNIKGIRRELSTLNETLENKLTIH